MTSIGRDTSSIDESRLSQNEKIIATNNCAMTTLFLTSCGGSTFQLWVDRWVSSTGEPGIRVSMTVSLSIRFTYKTEPVLAVSFLTPLSTRWSAEYLYVDSCPRPETLSDMYVIHAHWQVNHNVRVH